MSKMKKKTNKTMRLSVLAASLMMLTPLTHSADTHFSDKPLIGVSEEFAPHVVLALSVEFPTAGAAYFAKTNMTVANNTDPGVDVKTSYLGYFDNKKCYKYNHAEQYFYPSSMAQDKLCNNGSETEEFSGNMLNYMTMSSIDIFRSAMTGGNRAMGTGSEVTNYTNADTTTATYLRRANVKIDQNGLSAQRLRERTLRTFWGLNSNTNTKATMLRLLPHGYVEFAMQDAMKSLHRAGDPKSLGYEEWKPVHYQAPATVLNPNTLAGDYDLFKNHELYFVNDGFTVTLARKVLKRKLVKRADGTFTVEIVTYPHTDASGNTTNQSLEYFAVYKPRTYQSATKNDWVIPNERQWNEQWARPLNVVVKVCDSSNSSIEREANCKQYGNHYKPEGLLQEYAQKGMRVATMGYLNITGNSVHGGVLRSRMKQLINDPNQRTNQFQDEWDTQTGILKVNPDQEDANKTAALGVRDTITNSGAINYLNKFGDRSGYKTNDPGAELYYTALAYLRGFRGSTSSNTSLGNTTAVPYKPGTSGQIPMTALTSEAKDGFPAIFDWDDPFTRGIDPSKYQCHQNSIIYIGDTNTHSERELPGFSGTSGSPAKDGIETRSYLERVLAKEQPTPLFTIDQNVGAGAAGTSPAGIVGLAYWARVNDIRPDIVGTQNGNNFMIDVVESGKYKDGENSYYLAAKYGGFSRLSQDGTQVTNSNDATTALANKPLPDQRWMWTDDEQGTTSIQDFANGVPRNFAVANNPDMMVKALEKAMSVGTATATPTQAATGLAVNAGEEMDFTENPVQTMLQSTYKFAELTGDMVAYNVTYSPNSQDGTIFTRTEKWRASTALNSSYHNSTGYSLRKLYTIRNNIVYQFNEANANSIFSKAPDRGTTADLAKYILGDNSTEGTIYRKRASLMGTIVNSTIMPITKVGDNAPAQCSYQNLNAVQNRPTYFAAAANDGILHLIDSNGRPVAGYMAGIAVDKLSNFASINYTHKYLNDGTPVISELCMGRSDDATRVAKSILLGTTGRGGPAVYALDVTDVGGFSERNVLWEFTDSDLGYTVSKPMVTIAPDGRPLAIVSSGYNNSTDVGHLYILDISKGSGAWIEGQNYWKIRLGSSGVGAPFVYDQDNDGVGDKIFVGDLEGKLWQVDRTSTDKAGAWATAYTAAGGTPVPLFAPTTDVRPITGAPYADTVGGKLMVVVGTGKYFAENDLQVNQQNYAYGFIIGDQPINESTLLQQQFITTPLTGSKVNFDPNAVSFYSVTEHKMTETNQGWRLTLLPGQSIASESLIRQKQAAEFTAVRVTNTVSLQCQRSGSTSYISVDASTGGLNKRPMFDTNKDGKVDSSDERAASRENHGMMTTQTTLGQIRTADGVQTVAMEFDGGVPPAEMLLGNFDAVKGVRRISWREIF